MGKKGEWEVNDDEPYKLRMAINSLGLIIALEGMGIILALGAIAWHLSVLGVKL